MKAIIERINKSNTLSNSKNSLNKPETTKKPIIINNSSILELKELIYKLYKLIKKDIKIDIQLKKNTIYSNELVKKAFDKKRKYLIYTS